MKNRESEVAPYSALFFETPLGVFQFLPFYCFYPSTYLFTIFFICLVYSSFACFASTSTLFLYVFPIAFRAFFSHIFPDNFCFASLTLKISFFGWKMVQGQMESDRHHDRKKVKLKSFWSKNDFFVTIT